jgi:Methyltransferase domain
MDNILRALSASQIAVDLGCGGGSFHYASYPCQIIGIDVALNAQRLYRDGERVQYVRSNATDIPLASRSVDAVICNHTFEHFVDYRRTLSEINRVLKTTGMLWISIPNGYSFDDALYRFMYEGGGHLNRFTFSRLIDEVHNQTDLKLVQSISLFSGFVYLKKPAPEQLPHIPRLARALFHVPDRLNEACMLLINAVTRFVDKMMGCRISQYGWGFVFARGNVRLDTLPSYFNVCWKCGSGNDAQFLKSTGRLISRLGVRFYSCANCQAKSVFMEPPQGLS